MSTAAVKPVLLRARLTELEWLELRLLSTRERRPVADLVADALRAAYPLTPKEGQQ